MWPTGAMWLATGAGSATALVGRRWGLSRLPDTRPTLVARPQRSSLPASGLAARPFAAWRGGTGRAPVDALDADFDIRRSCGHHPPGSSHGMVSHDWDGRDPSLTMFEPSGVIPVLSPTASVVAPATSTGAGQRRTAGAGPVGCVPRGGGHHHPRPVREATGSAPTTGAHGTLTVAVAPLVAGLGGGVVGAVTGAGT